MRRIVVFERVSADGCLAGPDGGLDWFVPDDELDARAAAGVGDFDAMLFGRRTYEMFAAYWPYALDDTGESADPHQAGRRSPAIHAMAVWLNESPKWVFSTTLREATWRNSQLLRTLDPAQVASFKQQPGGDILVFGSGSIVTQLTAHGLVDEYRFVVSPVLLGSGRPVLDGLPARRSLALAEVVPFRSGNVLVRWVAP